MLIENPDAFKTWLTSILEPLCEADPAALAKYVYALVKKDKPLDDLRDGMVDQLDVFLQSETKPFVELLFKTLETQEYLAPVSSALSGLTATSTAVTTHSVTSSLQQDNAIAGPPSPTDDKAEIRPPSRNRKIEKEDLELKSLAPRSHADKRESASATKHRIVLNRTSKFVPATVPKEKPAYATEQTLVKVMPDLLEDSMNEPLPARNSRRDRKSDSDKEDRRRRVYRSRSRSWERSRRAPPAPAVGRWRNRSPPLQTRYRRSRSGSPPPLRVPRYRNVSPPPPGVTDIEPPKNRSRSRSRERMSPLPATALRDRLDRVSRERDRDRSSRSDRPPIRDRLDQRERIDRDRIIDQRERERIDRDNREQRLDRDRRVLRDPPGGADTPTQDSNPGDCAGQSRGTTTTLAGIFAPITKKRCRDFDEKGYCMRGDLCQFDHGLDPVVLEDATLSRVLALPITGIPPPRPIPGHLAEYNPLAPDIWTRGQQQAPNQPPHPNNRFSAPPPPPPPPHQLHPAHPAHPQHHLHMSRELIPIPTVRVEDLRPSIGQMGPGGVKASNGQQNMSVRPPALPGSGAQFPGQNQGPLPINNYNRRVFVPGQNSQSRHISPKMQGGNCSLELKKVPRGLNDILHLNNHFSKFGKIVNIQVSFEGDPEAAIITFSSHTEANVAYKSTEAVLNNRFIKVFWHNTESKQENVPPGQRVPVKDGKMTMPNHHNNNNHGSHNKVLINKDNLKITNTALAEAKLLTQQKLQKQQLEDAASRATASDAAGSAAAVSMEAVTPTSGEKEGVKMTNGEASQKPENGTARQETANIEMAALVKKRGEGHVKIVRDLRRRTQLLLEKQLGQQKALIIRLEENTIASQKDILLGTIKQMQGNIDKTRKDLTALTKASQQHTEESGVLESLNNMSLSTKSKYTTNNSIVGTIVKKPRSKEEAQKEILDAELDLFTKQQEGQDVTELMRKVADLRRQQSALRHASALTNRRGGPPQRAATRAKFSKIAAMAKAGGLYVNQSVDHRPRSLLISGYEGDEQTLVEQHFAQYGEIVRRVVDPKTPSLWIQYDSRKAAELASAKGKQFNDRTLSVTWMDPLKRQAQPVQPAVLPSAIAGPSSEPGTSSSATAGTSSDQQPQLPVADSKQQPEAVASSNADENNSTIDDQEFEGGVELSEDILLQDDEEEDEEDRSWRR